MGQHTRQTNNEKEREKDREGGGTYQTNNEREEEKDGYGWKNLPKKQRHGEREGRGGVGEHTRQTTTGVQRRTGRGWGIYRTNNDREREKDGDGWGNTPDKHLLGQSECQTLKGRSIFSLLRSERSVAGVPGPATTTTTTTTNQSYCYSLRRTFS